MSTLVSAHPTGLPHAFPLTLCSAVLLLCMAPAAQVVWREMAPASTPGSRAWHALAYDSQRQVTVLFGGLSASGISNETWEWNGSSWLQRNPANIPPARSLHAMAYDPVRGVTVMLGGRDPSFVILRDTWEWDGTDWTARPGHGFPRQDHAMVYDAQRSVIVLFGGRDQQRLLGDTLLWDGVSWTQANLTTTSLAARVGHAMAYDASRQVTMMFGGRNANNAAFSDQWEWNGTQWTRVVPATRIPPRWDHAMAYHAGRGTIITFGSSFDLDDTWEWDGSNWVEHRPFVAPPGRGGHAMVYDSARGEIVLVGGNPSVPLADTWGLVGFDFTAQTTGGGVGDLTLDIGTPPPHALLVWVLASGTPAPGGPGSGALFGLHFPDPLLFALLSFPPGPFSFFHFPVAANPYAGGPAHIPPGGLSFLQGQVWDATCIAYNANGFIGRANVARLNW